VIDSNVETVKDENTKEDPNLIKEEYEEVAEEPLVILQDEYDNKNEFYDSIAEKLVTQITGKTTEDDKEEKKTDVFESSLVKQDENHSSKNDQKTETTDDESPIKKEDERVKEFLSLRQTKKTNQKTFDTGLKKEFTNPKEVKEKAFYAKDLATNPDALYHMEMNNNLEQDNKEIQLEPINSKGSTNKIKKFTTSSATWSSLNQKTKEKSISKEKTQDELFDDSDQISTHSNSTTPLVKEKSIKTNSNSPDSIVYQIPKLRSPFPVSYQKPKSPLSYRTPRSPVLKKEKVKQEQVIKFNVEFEIRCKVNPSFNYHEEDNISITED